jgi:hypothetical protein
MLIHRNVFLDIEATFPALARKPSANGVLEKSGHWFTSSEHDLVESTKEALRVLNEGRTADTVRVIEARRILDACTKKSAMHSKLGTGEDVQFCIRAAQAGHQPHVDLGLVCGHIGNTCFGPRNTYA